MIFSISSAALTHRRGLQKELRTPVDQQPPQLGSDRVVCRTYPELQSVDISTKEAANDCCFSSSFFNFRGTVCLGMEENEGEDGQSVYFLSCVNVAIKLCATFNRVPSSISRPTSCIPKGSNGCPSLLENPVGTEIAGSP